MIPEWAARHVEDADRLEPAARGEPLPAAVERLGSAKVLPGTGQDKVELAELLDTSRNWFRPPQLDTSRLGY